jgi:hypothetical protein
MSDFRLSDLWLWRVLSSGPLRHLVLWKPTDVSETHVTYTFVRKVSENICDRRKYVPPKEMRRVLLLRGEVNPVSRECVWDLAAMRRYNMILKKET